MREKLLVVFIIILAGLLRVFELGSNPPSLDWDEASMGYNAYSILKTARDEYGNFLPLSIRSIDDYKPPVYTYLTVPAVAIFGLTEFAVRLSSAIIGTICVLVVYLFTKNIEEDIFKHKRVHPVALLACFFLAISPWHLQFSRTAFEGSIGVFFFTLGLWLFFKGLVKSKYLIFSSIAFVWAMYSYHSFRLLVPVGIVILGIFFRDKFRDKLAISGISFLVLMIASIPILQSFFVKSNADARFSMVTVFSDSQIIKQSANSIQMARLKGDKIGEFLNNRRFLWTQAIVKGYFVHFSPDFLLLRGDSGGQHQAADMGMLYLWDFPFLIAGIIFLFKSKSKKAKTVLIFILLAPIPGAIATDPPHAVRDIGSIPFMQIAVAMGVWQTILIAKKYLHQVAFKAAMGILVLLLVINFVYYLHQYYIVTPLMNMQSWQYGYKQAFETAKQEETNYRQIVVTYYYDQPYIYYLFFNKIDPAWYQKYWNSTESLTEARMYRKIGKYEFRRIDWTADERMKDALLVAAPQEIPERVKPLSRVYYPDGKIAFEVLGL